jgi:hypothetical protein
MRAGLRGYELQKIHKSMRACRIGIFLFLLVAMVACGGNLMADAQAGEDQFVEVGSTVNLDAGATTDRDDDSLSYLWEFESKPEESQAEIDDPHGITASFVADVAGEYVIRLSVNDGHIDSFDELSVSVNPLFSYATDSVAVLVIHDAETIYGWQPGETASDADRIIRTRYPSLIEGWEAEEIDVSDISVDRQDAYSPEKFQVVDGLVSKI